MSRRLNVACSLGAAVLLTQCVVANAAFTTPETEPFNLSTSAFGFTVVDGNLPGTNDGAQTTFADLTFDKFNTGLGTLIGVELTFSTTFGSVTTIDVSFTSSDVGGERLTFTTNGTQDLRLTGPGLTGVVPNPLSTTPTSISCSIEVDGTTCSDSTNDGASLASGFPFSLPLLADFQGSVPGTFVLTATLDSAVAPDIDASFGDIDILADNSTMIGTFATSWQGDVTVRFEYREPSTVPGPLTLYLLLAGAAGIALLRR